MRDCRAKDEAALYSSPSSLLPGVPAPSTAAQGGLDDLLGPFLASSSGVATPSSTLPPPPGTPAPSAAAQGGGLDDLLGPSSEPAAAAAPHQAAADLMDLLSASPAKPTAPPAAAGTPATAAADAGPAVAAAAAVSFPSVTAYQHAASGVSVTFSFSKVGEGD